MELEPHNALLLYPTQELFLSEDLQEGIPWVMVDDLGIPEGEEGSGRKEIKSWMQQAAAFGSQ